MSAHEPTPPEGAAAALALLDTLFSYSTVGFGFVDSGLRYVRINATLAAINGLPPEEHVGRTISEVLPELAAILEPLFLRVLETGEPVLGLEVSGETAAAPGVTRHWLTNYYPVRPGGGAPLGVGIVVTEVTERKRAEIEAREAEERLLRAQRAAGLGTWDWDLTTGRVIWSEGIYELLGLAPGSFEPSFDRWSQFVLPEDAERVRKAAEGAIARGGDFAADFRVRRADGEVRWLASVGRVEAGPDGVARRMTGVNIEITERKLAEERLRESEERFHRLVEVSPDAVAVHAGGVILFINTAGARLLGAEGPEQIVGRAVAEFIHPDYHAAVRERIEKLSGGVTSPPQEIRFVRLDGSDVYGELASAPLLYQGRPAIQAVVRDVTRRRQAEEERERLLREAQEANRLKDEFLATLSHELRTPSTAILGWSHMLGGDALDAEMARRAVDAIRRSAESQRQIVEDVLDASRIVTGNLRIEPEEVDLLGVVRGALDAVRPAAAAKGIELTCDFNPQACAVVGDPHRLRQVVWNLLSNAVKFTDPGGRVRIEAGRSLSSVRLTVSDTGQGISPDFLPYVFDRFRQADGSTTRRSGRSPARSPTLSSATSACPGWTAMS
jgi:PAS domain S-box-containing protein